MLPRLLLIAAALAAIIGVPFALKPGENLLAEADEATFREHLQCLKHKAHSLVWTGGEPLSGQWASCADVEFYVDHEMAHVADFSTTRRHMDFFVKQINKLEEIVSNLKT